MTRSVSVFSLNIEKNKHLHRFPSTIRALDSDIALLQEVRDTDTDRIAEEIGMKLIQFNPMKTDTPPVWGLATFVRADVADRYHCSAQVYYKETVGDVLLYRVAQFVRNDCGLMLCHTHFVWSPDGKVTKDQVMAGIELGGILSSQNTLALFGDSNTPRGTNSVWDVIGSQCVDHIPSEVKTTLDPELHRCRCAGIKHVVDMCFTKGDHTATDVSLHSAISDHLGVSAVIHY